MRHKLSHHQKMFQKMVLTPQMRHSIKLLSMSTKDINEYINSAVEANPFLMKVISRARKNGQEPWQNGQSGYESGAGSETSYDYADSAVHKESDARSSLLSQLRILGLEEKEMEIAEHVVSEIDDNGYITIPMDELAKDLFAPAEEVEECLNKIQSLDPPGIGARDVRECLQLQLKRMGKEDSVEYRIVSEFIHELATLDVEKISKALGVEIDDVRNAIFNIKKLNPHPASTMLSERPEPIMPDMVARVRGANIRLEVNKERLPRLRLYNPYENKLDIVKNPETRKFMKDNIDAARYLIDSLKRREETMFKVADYIVNFQRDDVINEAGEIRSLTIKDVSAALNLHSTTVNRAVSNKYIEVNDKVMPLKSLLSHGVKKENGEVTSKTSVKKKIAGIIRSEDTRCPLTDKAVQEKLTHEGIIIKRRTVAKYRTALRILPTHLRKKIN